MTDAFRWLERQQRGLEQDLRSPAIVKELELQRRALERFKEFNRQQRALAEALRPPTVVKELELQTGEPLRNLILQRIAVTDPLHLIEQTWRAFEATMKLMESY